jgi:hypothetical protein
MLAEEFIINHTGIPIQSAIDNGRFHTTVSLEGKFCSESNVEALGEAVVELLEEKGFEAEHVYYDGPNGYDNYILIKWEN